MKGFEYDKDKYVIVNEEELETINVIDLMVALQANIEATKPQPPTPAPKRKKRTKKESVS